MCVFLRLSARIKRYEADGLLGGFGKRCVT